MLEDELKKLVDRKVLDEENARKALNYESDFFETYEPMFDSAANPPKKFIEQELLKHASATLKASGTSVTYSLPEVIATFYTQVLQDCKTDYINLRLKNICNEDAYKCAMVPIESLVKALNEDAVSVNPLYRKLIDHLTPKPRGG